MIEEFWDQTCKIIKTTFEEDDDGNVVLKDTGSPNELCETVATLGCRVDPVRYRSMNMVYSDYPGVATAAQFKAVVYTEWTNVKITSDMRICVFAPEHEGGELEYTFNITAPPNKIRDMEGVGHHLEIQIDMGENV